MKLTEIYKMNDHIWRLWEYYHKITIKKEGRGVIRLNSYTNYPFSSITL